MAKFDRKNMMLQCEKLQRQISNLERRIGQCQQTNNRHMELELTLLCALLVNYQNRMKTLRWINEKFSKYG